MDFVSGQVSTCGVRISVRVFLRTLLDSHFGGAQAR